MGTHIFSGGDGAITQVANGWTFDPATPVKLKTSGKPGTAWHSNNSKAILIPLGTSKEHGTDMSNRYGAMDQEEIHQMIKNANFFVAHNVGFQTDILSVRNAFQELFRKKDLEINIASGKSGIIKLSSKISNRETDYLHSYSFLSVATDQKNNPSENWDFMCFHDNESKTLCIGDAKSKGIDIESWSGKILKTLADKKIDLDYGYAYHETLPFGQGYAVGVFCEDDKHDITEFEVAEEISQWLKNSPFDAEAHKIRDVFDVNVFSENFYKKISNELGENLKKTVPLQYLNSVFYMLVLEKKRSKSSGTN